MDTGHVSDITCFIDYETETEESKQFVCMFICSNRLFTFGWDEMPLLKSFKRYLTFQTTAASKRIW